LAKRQDRCIVLHRRIAPCEVLAGFDNRHNTPPFKSRHHPNSRIARRYPTISLRQARDQAKKKQAQITLGIEQNRSISFKEAREIFLEDCRSKNKKTTVDYYRKRLDAHFRFGRKRLDEISRADIQSRIRRIRTSPSEQHHAFVAIRTFLNWALREQHIETNPIAAMKPPGAPKPRERVLSEAELLEVFSKSNQHPYPFGPIVSLLILTGMRRNEVASREWDWINQDDRLITLPFTLTKNKRPHAQPYGNLVAEVLEQVPHASKYIFPSHSEKGTVFNGWGKSKARIDAELENVDPFTLHDLRRTFATSHAKIGTPIHVTEKLLNHVSGTISGVAAVYNRHSYLDEMREAIDQYDDYLASLVRE
jgi:integrase